MRRLPFVQGVLSGQNWSMPGTSSELREQPVFYLQATYLSPQNIFIPIEAKAATNIHSSAEYFSPFRAALLASPNKIPVIAINHMVPVSVPKGLCWSHQIYGFGIRLSPLAAFCYKLTTSRQANKSIMYNAIESLHPGNFALVMATGIIGIALEAHGFGGLSSAFSVFAVLAWLILLLLCIIRAVAFAKAVYIDLNSPRMVFSYFTLVAATDIVGMVLHNYGFASLAIVCWFIAFFCWCLLLYLAFSVLTFMSHEHNVNIMHGGWLITIVGTQSLVLLGIKIAPSFGDYVHYMMVEVHMLWGLGLCLYGIFVTLFCYRIFFLSLKPQDLSPLLWVVMGAAAISANAGTSLLESQGQLSFLANQKPFIDGVTLMIFSWATWLIPLLALFGIWKHVVRKLPFQYEPTIWSMVFPLGMYTVASERLGQVAEFPPLIWISQIMILLSLTAWVFSLGGLLSRIKRVVTGVPV